MKVENQPEDANQIEAPRVRDWAGPLVRWGALGIGVLATVGVVSCSTVTRTVVAPPQIAGADFVGSENCTQCHQEIAKGFHTATHAKIVAKGENAKHLGCESCHGPGSLHSQSGGARHTIVNPRQSSESCLQCHLDKRGEFNLPSHHPVPEGKMSCSDCHDSHKGPATRGGAMQLSSAQDACAKCHTAQHGPFVFEHEAVREGCTICHNPHGTVNAKMLVQRDANLCLKCHFQQQTGAGLLIGGSNHASAGSNRLMRGTCWTAGCHEAVHGSQIGSSLRF